MRLQKPTIGLFGTCGNTTWRKNFILTYKDKGIEWFNPQKDNWSSEDAEIEARHLAEDEIILFPVTSETYGLGSLSEVGFSILQAIALDSSRDFIVLIDNFVDDNLKENTELAKESIRGRALVKQHLKKLRLSNLYLVDTMEEMLNVSLLLYPCAEVKNSLKHLNPHNKHGI